MIYEMEGAKLPIKVWTDYVESGAEAQARNLANHPRAFHHIALMPDVHQGMGMPIGGVIALRDAISVSCVGVDIGCGMICAKTGLKSPDLDNETIKKIMGTIRETIPVGFAHQEIAHPEWMPDPGDLDVLPVVRREWGSATKQVASLGGGNHFWQIHRDKNMNLYVMIHSGSRNLGKQVADYYDKLAKQFNKDNGEEIPASWDLCYLPVDDEHGQTYLKEMQYCLEFALANRKAMMHLTEEAFKMHSKCKEFGDTVNIHHNFVSSEKHFGETVWVHRKGATSAQAGEVGIIPGSQGTKSYIVEGLGNPDSFKSCSHGAGRKMGRNEAKRTLNLEEEMKKMDDQGIIHGMRTVQELDEADGSYKNIEAVLRFEEDLVKIKTELFPVAVIKG